MSYKILHLPTATYMYWDTTEIDSPVIYSEYETHKNINNKHDFNSNQYSCIFSSLAYVEECINVSLELCKQAPSGLEYEFDPGIKSNILFCHFEIQEVKDV